MRHRQGGGLAHRLYALRGAAQHAGQHRQDLRKVLSDVVLCGGRLRLRRLCHRQVCQRHQLGDR